VKSGKFESKQKRRKSRSKKVTKTLDKFSIGAMSETKSNRGRPSLLSPYTVTGRAVNYERELNEVWERLETPLLNSKTADEVTEAFKKFAKFCAEDFVPGLSADILFLLNHSDFPQRQLPRTRFLARSLGGRPNLSFRRSRDICEAADKKEKQKSPHRILRREFYVECSCGYRGPAFNNGCWKCGAQPELLPENWTGEALGIQEFKIERRILKTPQPEPHQETTTADSPNTLRCECGAIVGASSPEEALEALAEHKRKEHGGIADKQTEEPTE
jgi:hypothetical protein